MDKKYRIIGILIVFVLVGGYFVRYYSALNLNVDDINDCQVDDDCATVEGRYCCGCGGNAINKDYVNQWNRAGKQETCFGVSCEMCPGRFIGVACGENNKCRNVYDTELIA